MQLRSIALLACLFVSFACAARKPDASPGHDYSFVYLRSGANTAMPTGEERASLQQGHMANIQRLAAEKRLLVAGPFGQPNPDPQLRGLFVMASSDTKEVAQLLTTDPAVHAGTLVPEVVPLSTSSDLRAALERHEDFDARRKADPASEPGNGMQSYVVVFAKDGARARRALESLRAQQRIVLDGDFGGTRKGEALFVLAAKDVLEANTWIAPLADQLGEHQLVPWWGSAYLPEPRGS